MKMPTLKEGGKLQRSWLYCSSVGIEHDVFKRNEWDKGQQLGSNSPVLKVQWIFRFLSVINPSRPLRLQSHCIPGNSLSQTKSQRPFPVPRRKGQRSQRCGDGRRAGRLGGVSLALDIKVTHFGAHFLRPRGCFCLQVRKIPPNCLN